MNDDLLTPSLEKSEPKSILSSGALMGAAFFGGPVAVTIIATMNSGYLDRLNRDWPMLLGVFAAGVVATYLFAVYAFDVQSNLRSLRLAVRAAGFVSFGVVWLMHSKELRALSTLGIRPRSPWVPVIGACIVGIVVNMVIVALFQDAYRNGL